MHFLFYFLTIWPSAVNVLSALGSDIRKGNEFFSKKWLFENKFGAVGRERG
jgi:hypothetical protein